MNCIKCKTELRDGARFCDMCGASQTPVERQKKKRGNGQGSVYKLKNGKYMAAVTLGYLEDEDGKQTRKTKTKCFATKKDAIAALPTLAGLEKEKEALTFSKLYDKWLPTHNKVDKKTIGCYTAAYKHFSDIYFIDINNLTIEDLQECIDTCGRSRRTQENMRSLVSLMYKYAIPRGNVKSNINMAQFLTVSGEESAERTSFTAQQIEFIKNQIGKTPFAEYVYCLIYLGYRPTEFLTLDVKNYDRKDKLFRHGAKTEAGKDRCVTISPKIQQYIDKLCTDKIAGPVFCDKNGKQFTLKYFTKNIFYPVVEAAGIDNPKIKIAGGLERKKYTPHSCRHTFATLLKNVAAPSKDKQKLIGHTSEEMLKYYQDVNAEDLRKITDII